MKKWIKMKNKSFVRGIIAGIAIIVVIDFPVVHWILGWHRTFNGPSVDIVEPILFVLAIIVLAKMVYDEYCKK